MDSATRQLVRHRAGNQCEYCRIHQEHEPFYQFHVEHIVARVHGGADDDTNLALACHCCNEHKGTNLSGRDPQTGNIVRLFNPRRQNWSRHFRHDGPHIIGRTQIGQRTTALLAMNASDRTELRTELLEGDYPVI